MPRKNPLPEHEIAICRRLRAFRQSTGIHRKLFAQKAGIRDSLLVSIEHLRAPLRYRIYKTIDSQFPINPFWLRTGDGVPQIGASIDDSLYADQVKRGDLFSTVYDRFLMERINKELDQARWKISEAVRAVRFVAEMAKAGKLLEHPLTFVQEILNAQDSMVKEIGYLFDYADKVEARLKKRVLTEVSLKSKIVPVISEIEKLIRDVKRKASQPGAKSALAKELGVAPARISEWLSGEKEPGGNYTLRLAIWVYGPRRK